MGSVSRSTKSPWRILKGDISASSSEVVDSTANTTLSYYYIINAEGSNKVKQLHYQLVKDSGNLKSSIGPKVGSLKISVTENDTGGNIELTVTNDEAFDISYEIAVLRLLG